LKSSSKSLKRFYQK